MEEKLSFFDELIGEWDMYGVGDLVMCLVDFDGHIGRHINGFDGVHILCAVGHRNMEGRMLLEFSWRMNYVCQIHGFMREDKRKVTFGMGEMRKKLSLC